LHDDLQNIYEKDVAIVVKKLNNRSNKFLNAQYHQRTFVKLNADDP